MSLAELVASKRDHSGTHKLCTGLAAVVSREARVGNVHVSHSDVVVVAEGSRRRAGEAGDVIDRAVARLPVIAGCFPFAVVLAAVCHTSTLEVDVTSMSNESSSYSEN